MDAPSAHCFPSSDDEFASDVAAAITISRGRIEIALDCLRPKYPSVRITERHHLGSDYQGEPVWYCYRDGRVMPPAI